VTTPLLDAKQAGELLNVPDTWVLQEARANRIPHVRLGRYVRFVPQVLEEWWTARLQGPVHSPYPERTPNNKVGRRCANTPTRGAQEK
jgi:excisionase family DNA binding protein